MGIYLNSIAPYEKYKLMVSSRYFVDKTALIGEITDNMEGETQYLCITRPRRFGKTVMANMLAAYFGKGYDSSTMFDKLSIAQHHRYMEHLNKHDVIYIDFSDMPQGCKSYEQYITNINDKLVNDLAAAYPELGINTEDSIWYIMLYIFEQKQQKFIFIIDEWDAVFHMSFMTERDKNDYLLFLKSLLKSKVYVELAYMTGILPISKYSDGSELNMFIEYQMTTMGRFSDYFGFNEQEVDALYERYLKNERRPMITREEIKEWYDGYHTIYGERLYNPRSVVCALNANQLSSYWTDSGRYDSIYFYIKNNIDDVRDDLALMVAGERVNAKIQNYAAVSMELKTRNQIYSAMVVYGLLTYEDGEVFIPNKELMMKFAETLQEYETLGYVYRLAKASDKMLAATIAGDTETMTQILQYAHDTETPILSYNHETELSAIVNLVYLSARDRYRIEREDKAGKGFVDFIFYPRRRKDDAIILELKSGDMPENAITQIKEKQYAVKLKGRLCELPEYNGRILAVGISYDKNTKEHCCKIEVLGKC